MQVAHPAEGHQQQGDQVVHEHLPEVLPLDIDELRGSQRTVEGHRDHVVPPNVGIYGLEERRISKHRQRVASQKDSPDGDSRTSSAWCPRTRAYPTARSARKWSCTCNKCISMSSRRTSPASRACPELAWGATNARSAAPLSRTVWPTPEPIHGILLILLIK